MSDGAIGNAHVTIPDFIEPIVAFRSLVYDPPKRLIRTSDVDESFWNEPNDFIMVDGQLRPDHKRREDAYRRAMAEARLLKKGILVEWKARLISPNQSGYVWNRENVALCNRTLWIENTGAKTHDIPGHNCECGLYCYYSPAIPGTTTTASTKGVGAIVTVTGRIEAHGTGMRAQYMTIEHLFSTIPEVQGIAEDMEIPYTILKDNFEGSKTIQLMQDLSLEYGSPMPDNMKP